jgi:hypothetical protein
MKSSPAYTSFISYRQQLISQTDDPALKQHYQAEIDLIASWDSSDIDGPSTPRALDSNYDIEDPATRSKPPPSRAGIDQIGWHGNEGDTPPIPGTSVKPSPTKPSSETSFSTVPDGYAQDWHTTRFSNTTSEPITVHITMANGQPMPAGVDPDGNFTIQPGQFVDITFPPGASVNFKSTKGDGSVWNQGELYFDEANHIIWGDMSYIYGANSNMRIFSQDGQHSGYLGDLFANVPPGAKIDDWGIMAPYDRFHPSDDPNNPNSATGGPDGSKNSGSAYFYDILEKGEGYVGRGRPIESSDYDDASSLRFTGNVAIAF